MRKNVIVMTILLFGLLAINPCFAQIDQKNVELISVIGEISGLDRAWDVAFSPDGEYAYIAGKGPNAPRVWIMDVSVPANLSTVGTIDIINPVGEGNKEVWGVQSVGNLLYIAAFKSGLFIYDITAPTAPVLKGSYSDDCESRGLYVDGDYAYVADAWKGLSIYNISVPTAPVRVSRYNTDADIGIANPQDGKEDAEFHGVKVVGDIAYCAAGNFQLVTVNVADKAAPAGLGFLPKAGWSRGIDVAGNYAYICGNDGLTIADVTSAAAPAIVGAGYKLDGKGDLWHAQVIGTKAYLPYEKAGFITLDVTDPAAPSVLDSLWIAGKNRAIAVLGTKAYVVEDKSFHIVDLSGAANIVGTTSKPGVKRPWMVKVVGDYAYIADLGLPGLLIYDVSTPAAPVMMASAVTPSGQEAWDVDIAGNYAYVASMKDGLVVFDITDKGNPTVVGQCVTTDNSLFKSKNSESRGVKIVGNYAYVGDAWGGLTVMDITNPAAPARIANVGNANMEAHRLDVQGNYCYIGGGKGVSIYDISTPAAPDSVSFVPKSDKWIRGARVLDNNVYYFEGFGVADVTDPSNPAELSYYWSPEKKEGWDCQVRAMTKGTYAFYGAERALRVLDVSNVVDTTYQVAYYWDQSTEPSVPKGKGIDVVGDYVYMAGEDPGVVCIFKFTEDVGISQGNNGEIPSGYALAQNYPNPFNPTTQIKYQTREFGNVKIVVYSLTGQEVRTLVNQNQSAGFYTVLWDGRDNNGRQTPSGIYFYRMQSDNGFMNMKRMILIK